MRLNDDQLRTQALCHLYGLRRMNSIAAGLVAGSRHHAPLGIVTDSYRLTPKLRLVKLLDCSEELVHIHMNDFHTYCKGSTNLCNIQPFGCKIASFSVKKLIKW
jgi:hypothetical protein